MKNLKKSLFFPFIFLVLNGCTDTPSGLLINPGEIWPLKVGNQWIYKEYQIDSAGVRTERGFDTLTVIDTKIVNNETWYGVYNNVPLFSTMYMANRSDGLYILFDGASGLFLKFPAKAGEVIGETAEEKMEVLSTNTSITTPARTFQCYAYLQTENYIINGESKITKSTTYIAPNIGPVKSETKAQNGAVSISELISFTLK